MKYLFTFKYINKYLENKHSKIYHTFIQSTLSNGIEIRGKCYNTHLIDLKRRIEKLQKNLGLTHDKTILPFDQFYLYRLITTFHDYTKIHPINTVTSRCNLRNNSIPRITPKLETVIKDKFFILNQLSTPNYQMTLNKLKIQVHSKKSLPVSLKK